ncbi:MAG: purine-nucleoside phosphorylase [Candidatus Eisenbacteria bacterium]|nr:purine-nucleoside phosphorylase [Candidatus Eisenbacteria bacterium]
MTSRDRLARSVDWLGRAGFGGATLGIVLGSGLSSFLDGVEVIARARCADVPGFPVPGVGGHDGAVVSCTIASKPALVISGRVHHYEGRGPDEVVFAVRALRRLGVVALALTNASGGVDPGFSVGDVMLIVDQISLLGGRCRTAGAPTGRAPAYSPRLAALARDVGAARGIALREGVYLGSLGPAYETPAEISLARRLGASAVGMSTVSEAAAAAGAGMEVLGLSLITNVPLPGRFTSTTHGEVLRAGRAGSRKLLSLVEGVAERL